MIGLAMIPLVLTHVVPFSAVEGVVATLLQIAEVLTIRQSAPVQQELRESLEQVECVVLSLIEGQVDCPVEIEGEAVEGVEHVYLEGDPVVQDLRKLNVTNYQIVLLTNNVRAYQADVWILVLTMWKQEGLHVELELTVLQLVTRLYAPVLRLTQETPLCPAAPSPKPTCATPILVVLTLFVSLVWITLLERTDQFACVRKGTEAMV